MFRNCLSIKTYFNSVVVVKIRAYKHVKPSKLEKKLLVLGGGLCVLIFVFVCSNKMIKWQDKGWKAAV